jgi:uncharacterized membrane protein
VHVNVGTIERVGSVSVGLALLYFASRRRRSRHRGGRLIEQAGVGLVVRGLVGYCPISALVGRDTRSRDTRVALGGDRGVHILQSVVVPVSPAAAYRFWRDLSNLPSFMSHLRRVDVVDATHSRWIAAAPAGLHVAWDAKIINDIENKLIGWRSLESADVVSAGSVRFRPTASGTEITVHLQYEPPGGRLGDWIAEAFGHSPAQTIRKDLERLPRELAAWSESHPQSGSTALESGEEPHRMWAGVAGERRGA